MAELLVSFTRLRGDRFFFSNGKKLHKSTTNAKATAENKVERFMDHDVFAIKSYVCKRKTETSKINADIHKTAHGAACTEPHAMVAVSSSRLQQQG